MTLVVFNGYEPAMYLPIPNARLAQFTDGDSANDYLKMRLGLMKNRSHYKRYKPF